MKLSLILISLILLGGCATKCSSPFDNLLEKCILNLYKYGSGHSGEEAKMYCAWLIEKQFCYKEEAFCPCSVIYCTPKGKCESQCMPCEWLPPNNQVKGKGFDGNMQGQEIYR